MSRKLAESRFRSANRSFSGGLRDRFPLSVLLAFRDVFTVRIRFSLPPFPPGECKLRAHRARRVAVAFGVAERAPCGLTWPLP